MNCERMAERDGARLGFTGVGGREGVSGVLVEISPRRRIVQYCGRFVTALNTLCIWYYLAHIVQCEL